MILSSIVLWRTFSKLEKIGGKFEKQKGRIENTGKYVLQYFLTYVIPFLTVEILDWQDLATYGIIFFIIGILYIKSDLIYLNPTLLLLRYNIFKVVTDEREIVIISKNHNNKIMSNPVIEIGTGVYYERTNKFNRNNSNSSEDTPFSG
jgi:hypothetical protein